MVHEHATSGKKPPRLIVFIMPAAAILIAAALWRFTPLRAIASPDKLQEIMRAQWTQQWWTVLLVIALYLLANLLMFPNALLNVAVILGVGGFTGWLYAICGSLSAATVFFFAGRFWGVERLNALDYTVIPKIKTFLGKGGVAAVVAVRAVPSAPYTAVNAIIGTFDVGYRDFIVGTFLAHLPGTLCLALFGSQLKNLIADPSPQNMALFLLIIGAAGAVIFVLRARLKARVGDESDLADHPESRS
ncbi:MAG: VTT domain-containing protein [Lentisphaeria bacterium]|nr:VTT domain-containing protein [Lentisphaeria bacterium]